MINSITARKRDLFSGAVYKELILPMAGSEYVIKDVSGIGPVDTSLGSFENVGDPGNTTISGHEGGRNIVLTIGFAPNFAINSTIALLRQKLYELFMPNSEIELIFDTAEYPDLTIKGTVETHTPVIFSSDPIVQISIMCDDPYFDSDDPLTVFSITPGSGSFYNFVLPFDGLVPVGYIFKAKLKAVQTQFVLTKRITLTRFTRISILHDFLVDDQLTINTVKGSRDASYIRSGGVQGLLGKVSGLVDSKLTSGNNNFTLTDSSKYSDISIQYKKRYGAL